MARPSEWRWEFQQVDNEYMGLNQQPDVEAIT
jgi:hypothetical protein